jgi:predicted transcriptional regulator
MHKTEGVWGMELTKSEMQIMDVFWEAGEPLSRSDLLERSEHKSWKDSSVHILLNGLLQKDMIREVGFVKRSKTYGRTFLPNMTREEYFAAVVFSYRHKPDPVALVKALVSRKDLEPQARQDIKNLLAEM